MIAYASILLLFLALSAAAVVFYARLYGNSAPARAGVFLIWLVSAILVLAGGAEPELLWTLFGIAPGSALRSLYQAVLIALGVLCPLYVILWFNFPRRPPGEEKGIVREREERSEPAKTESISRAEFFQRGGLFLHALGRRAPIPGVGLALGGMFLGSHDIQREKREIRIRDLPEDLKGLSIAHISDLHVGPLIDETYLKVWGDLLKNSVRADLLVVTGDLIELRNEHLRYCLEFLTSLSSRFRLGVFIVPGNHDYYHDGADFKRMTRQAGLNLLADDVSLLRRGRGELNLMGLDYTGGRRGYRGSRSMRSWLQFQATRNLRKPDIPTVVLNHYPSDFKWLRDENVDLVRSGHTHGGQVSFSAPGEHWANPASYRYKYISGFYRENGVCLYVNRGLGHSLTLRWNVYPEITEIVLV